jgi:hypothetical protein
MTEQRPGRPAAALSIRRIFDVSAARLPSGVGCGGGIGRRGDTDLSGTSLNATLHVIYIKGFTNT